MKYYELLKDPSMGAQTSAPIEVVVESQDSKKIDDISENVAKIMAFMESQLGKDNNPRRTWRGFMFILLLSFLLLYRFGSFPFDR